MVALQKAFHSLTQRVESANIDGAADAYVAWTPPQASRQTPIATHSRGRLTIGAAFTTYTASTIFASSPANIDRK